jgi:hypothetical protein
MTWRSLGSWLCLCLLCCAPAVAGADNGALNPDVTQSTIRQTICVPGYAKSVRPDMSYANGVKRILMEHARINPAVASYYELDHIIPLALGGHPTDRRNLALQIREGRERRQSKA